LTILLRLAGCLCAGSIAFLVCMLIASELFGSSVDNGAANVWEMLVSLVVAGAFGWAFWKWPGKKSEA
jgi:hypothetical protein